MKTKRIVSMLLLLVCISLQAQKSLEGRVYSNPNILADKMKEMTTISDKDIQDAKAEAMKKAEEKKGRKLTAAEMAEVDKKIAEAQKMMRALEKGMSTAIEMTFKDATHVVMKVDMKIDEEVLKAAGIGWAKRKMLKAAMAIMPSQKGTYTVKGNRVIVADDEEPDTMMLSDDGKYLSGKLDEKTPFKLTRVK